MAKKEIIREFEQRLDDLLNEQLFETHQLEFEKRRDEFLSKCKLIEKELKRGLPYSKKSSININSPVTKEDYHDLVERHRDYVGAIRILKFFSEPNE